MKQDRRKSFLLYLDTLDIFDKLSDREGMMLFKAIRDYSENLLNDGNREINIEDRTVSFLFEQFKTQLVRDNEKYKERVEKRKASGRKGGLARAKKTERTKTVEPKIQKEEDFLFKSDPNAKEGDIKTLNKTDYIYEDNRWVILV